MATKTISILTDQADLALQQLQKLDKTVKAQQNDVDLLNLQLDKAYQLLSDMTQQTYIKIRKTSKAQYLTEQRKDGYEKLSIMNVQQISWDTYIYQIKLPETQMTLGLPVGKHLKIRAFLKFEDNQNGEYIVRKYTPISAVHEEGSFKLLIKIYRPNQDKLFPMGGTLTPHIETLKVGDQIEISGPEGSVSYQGQGKIQIGIQTVNVSQIALIGGGTGITPLYQIIQAVLDNKEDKTQITLLYFNKTTKDILLRKELEQYQRSHPNQFKLHLILTRDEQWQGMKGRISPKLMKDLIPLDKKPYIFYCGPNEFTYNIQKYLVELNFDTEYSYKF